MLTVLIRNTRYLYHSLQNKSSIILNIWKTFIEEIFLMSKIYIW